MSFLTDWFAAAWAANARKPRCDKRGCHNTATEYDAALDVRTCELHGDDTDLTPGLFDVPEVVA